MLVEQDRAMPREGTDLLKVELVESNVAKPLISPEGTPGTVEDGFLIQFSPREVLLHPLCMPWASGISAAIKSLFLIVYGT